MRNGYGHDHGTFMIAPLQLHGRSERNFNTSVAVEQPMFMNWHPVKCKELNEVS